MIDIKSFGVNKKAQSSNGGTVIINANKSQSNNATNVNGWKPIHFWGNYCDDTKDIEGDLNHVHNIYGDGSIFMQKANFDDLSSHTIKADILNIIDGYIQSLSSKDITTENLLVTGQAHFFELVIDKIKAAGGAVMLTPADGFKVVKVERNTATQRTKLYFLAEEPNFETTKEEAQDYGESYTEQVNPDFKYLFNQWEIGDHALLMDINKGQKDLNPYSYEERSYYVNEKKDLDSRSPERTNKDYITEVDGTIYDFQEGTALDNNFFWKRVTDTIYQPVDVNLGTVEEPNIVKCFYIEVDDTSGRGTTAGVTQGDEVVMCGNDTKEERQNCIYITAYRSLDTDLKGPLFAQYRGVNDFYLEDHKISWLSGGVTAQGRVKGIVENQIQGNFRVETNGGTTDITEYINLRTDLKDYKMIDRGSYIRTILRDDDYVDIEYYIEVELIHVINEGWETIQNNLNYFSTDGDVEWESTAQPYDEVNNLNVIKNQMDYSKICPVITFNNMFLQPNKDRRQPNVIVPYNSSKQRYIYGPIRVNRLRRKADDEQNLSISSTIDQYRDLYINLCRPVEMKQLIRTDSNLLDENLNYGLYSSQGTTRETNTHEIYYIRGCVNNLGYIKLENRLGDKAIFEIIDENRAYIKSVVTGWRETLEGIYENFTEISQYADEINLYAQTNLNRLDNWYNYLSQNVAKLQIKSDSISSYVRQVALYSGKEQQNLFGFNLHDIPVYDAVVDNAQLWKANANSYKELTRRDNAIVYSIQETNRVTYDANKITLIKNANIYGYDVIFPKKRSYDVFTQQELSSIRSHLWNNAGNRYEYSRLGSNYRRDGRNISDCISTGYGFKRNTSNTITGYSGVTLKKYTPYTKEWILQNFGSSYNCYEEIRPIILDLSDYITDDENGQEFLDINFDYELFTDDTTNYDYSKDQTYFYMWMRMGRRQGNSVIVDSRYIRDKYYDDVDDDQDFLHENTFGFQPESAILIYEDGTIYDYVNDDFSLNTKKTDKMNFIKSDYLSYYHNHSDEGMLSSYVSNHVIHVRYRIRRTRDDERYLAIGFSDPLFTRMMRIYNLDIRFMSGTENLQFSYAKLDLLDHYHGVPTRTKINYLNDSSQFEFFTTPNIGGYNPQLYKTNDGFPANANKNTFLVKLDNVLGNYILAYEGTNGANDTDISRVGMIWTQWDIDYRLITGGKGNSTNDSIIPFFGFKVNNPTSLKGRNLCLSFNQIGARNDFACQIFLVNVYNEGLRTCYEVKDFYSDTTFKDGYTIYGYRPFSSKRTSWDDAKSNSRTNFNITIQRDDFTHIIIGKYVIDNESRGSAFYFNDIQLEYGFGLPNSATKTYESEIIQEADRISLAVYEKIDNDLDGITDDLKRTGIDIESGKITLEADNTNIIGSLNITGDNSDFNFIDSNGRNGFKFGNIDIVDKANFTSQNITKFITAKCYRDDNYQAWTDNYISIGTWTLPGNVVVTAAQGYLYGYANGGSGISLISNGTIVNIKPYLYTKSIDPNTNEETYTMIYAGSEESGSCDANANITMGGFTAYVDLSTSTELYLRYKINYINGTSLSGDGARINVNLRVTISPSDFEPHNYLAKNGMGIMFNKVNYFYMNRFETEWKYSSDSIVNIDSGGLHLVNSLGIISNSSTNEYIGSLSKKRYILESGRSSVYNIYLNSMSYYWKLGDVMTLYVLDDLGIKLISYNDGYAWRVLEGNNLTSYPANQVNEKALGKGIYQFIYDGTTLNVLKIN